MGGSLHTGHAMDMQTKCPDKTFSGFTGPHIIPPGHMKIEISIGTKLAPQMMRGAALMTTVPAILSERSQAAPSHSATRNNLWWATKLS